MQKELEYVQNNIEVIATKYLDGTFKCKFCGLVDTPERMLKHYWDTHRKDGDSVANPNDPVNHPSHYTQGGIECIDAIGAAVGGLSGMDAVLTSQIIKYIWRWKHKNGVEDLRKAGWYLDRLIKAQEVSHDD